MDTNATAFSDVQSPAKDKSAPGLRRSCEACRASKGRCCPSQDDVTRCLRCVRDKKQCIFLEAKPRQKRARTSRARVAEMEQRLDGILATLSARNASSPVKDTTVPDIPSAKSSMASDQSECAVVLQPHNAMSNIQPLTFVTPALPSWMKFDEISDVVGRGIISYDKAETLLRSYGTHAPNFPFIVFAPNVSLDSLRRERPFLLLAILTMTSISHTALQDSLEAELRETLGRKLIFNGEKSLDLLQGLLIYLAWYHQYFRPDRQQIYQLSQMVIAMVADLEISSSESRLPDSLSTLAFGDIRGSHMHAHRFPSELEAMRTFLGCYYLSSCLAVSFRKPNNLKYTDHVDKCCEALTAAKETPSDCLLPYFVRAQRVTEEINMAFDYGGHQQLPPLDAVRTEMLLKTFRKQLKQLEDSFPLDVWQNVAIRMTFLHANTFVNEIALHAIRPDPSLSITTTQASCHEWYHAVARTETLIACLESAKKYVSTYLKLAGEVASQNTIMEEMKLVYTILIIGRFTSGVDSPFLDASYLREIAQLGHYMSALIAHLNQIISYNGNGRERVDYVWHFRRIFQHTKNWYEEQVREGIYTTLEKKGLPDCMDLSFMEIMEMDPDPQYANPVEAQDTTPAEEDELWTVAMLEAWPTSTLDPRTMSLNGGFQ